jgi:hypothetical protein
MKPARLLWVAALGSLLLACGETPPVGVGTPPASPPARLDWQNPPIGLLQCTPLPYDSATQTIGPEGGSIQAGPHVLRIPSGALADSVTITMVAPSDTVNRVRFQPEGLTFASPARLSMSYANCSLLGQLLPKRIAYTTDALVVLQYLLSIDDVLAQRVTGQVNHFSNYAIAW